MARTSSCSYSSLSEGEPDLGRHDGDLTFTLSSTLDIRIPNHQLVLSVPDDQVDLQGQKLFSSNKRVVLINSPEGTSLNNMPYLGRHFSSPAHLVVSNELETFTISQSNLTETKNLMAIGPQSCSDSPPPVTSSSALGSPSTPAPTKSLSSGSSSISSNVPHVSPSENSLEKVIAQRLERFFSFCC